MITNAIIRPNEKSNKVVPISATNKGLNPINETSASSLLDSSNSLVTELGEYPRSSSQNSMIPQGIFAVLTIAVAVGVLYLVLRILKPIFALISATSEISKGNLDISVKGKGSDEVLYSRYLD
jgi:nitrate/nitrite-specific signal transduction histidine kinase